MAPVFAHGRLRLYLLKLLDEAPRHGYEVIRLLEERFHGLYAPSAGTVYPRLAKLEQEGLVTHSTEGGRKVYALTDDGRAELAARAGEIAGLEAEIRESVSTLAAEIREDVRGAAGDLRRELRAAGARNRVRHEDAEPSAKQAWKEQAHRAKEESRRAKEEARAARSQAKAAREAMDGAREEVQRIARQVQEQVQAHTKGGDWQAGLREGLTELTRELGRFGAGGAFGGFGARPGGAGTGNGAGADGTGTGGAAGPSGTGSGRPWSGGAAASGAPGAPTSVWGEATAPPCTGPERDDDLPPADDLPPSQDPLRDLERLLDRFRDDVRDAARDRGVDDGTLREVRRHLKSATAHIIAALHTGNARAAAGGSSAADGDRSTDDGSSRSGDGGSRPGDGG